MSSHNIPALPGGWTVAVDTPKHVSVHNPEAGDHLLSLSRDPHTPGKTWAVHGLKGFDDHPLFSEGERFDEAFATTVDVINAVDAGHDVEAIPDDHRPEPGAVDDSEPELEPDSDPDTASADEPAGGDDTPAQSGLDQWT